jgi:8-oxo-dGTP diphosphatase
VIVVAAVVRHNDRFLVTRRLRGVHLEGYWEFPGGKCASGETHVDCLRREMLEELDVDVDVAEKLLSTTHDYPEKCVELHFYRCSLRGEPRPLLGQEMQWVERRELKSMRFPAADAELIELLSASVDDR